MNATKRRRHLEPVPPTREDEAHDLGLRIGRALREHDRELWAALFRAGRGTFAERGSVLFDGIVRSNAEGIFE